MAWSVCFAQMFCKLWLAGCFQREGTEKIGGITILIIKKLKLAKLLVQSLFWDKILRQFWLHIKVLLLYY